MGWDKLGGLLQLVGVVVVAYGVMELRYELDREHSALGRLRRAAGWSAAHRRQAAAWIKRRLTDMRRRARDLWLRWRRKTHARVAVKTATETEVAMSVTPGKTTVSPPPWESMDRDERIKDLHRRVGRLQDQASKIEETQRRDREDLEEELRATRQYLEDLHMGGLSVEAWGLQFIAAGIFIAVWSEWVAASVVMQALLLGWALLAAGLWATGERRRWWRLSGG